MFEYVHAGHVGSPAAVKDASGAELLSLAHGPYGARRNADWTAQLPAAATLAAGQDAGRARSGFTGHEPLDRTGFVHMNGRLHDPRLGRFLSPDRIVSEPWSGQGWNPYSYVGNSPLSRTDPTGYCYVAGPMCGIGQDGGFTSRTATLFSRSLSWRVPVVLTVHWGRVSFGDGRSSRTTHASGLAVTYEYNARGYLSKLKHGAAALVTVAEADAWGNATRET